MGCGASSTAAASNGASNGAPPAEARFSTPNISPSLEEQQARLEALAMASPSRDSAQKLQELQELKALWEKLAGTSPDSSLSRAQLRNVYVMLGRALTDEEFDSSFAKMDSNGSGDIEYEEFVVFYQSQSAAEQWKVRALKAEAELLRRLEAGELTDAEATDVRERLVQRGAEASAESLGLTGGPEEAAAAAKMQAIQRGRQDRAVVVRKRKENERVLLDSELAKAREKFDEMDKDGNGEFFDQLFAFQNMRLSLPLGRPAAVRRLSSNACVVRAQVPWTVTRCTS